MYQGTWQIFNRPSGVSNMESNITTNAVDVSDQFASSQGFDSLSSGEAKGGDLGFLNGHVSLDLCNRNGDRTTEITLLSKPTQSIDHYGIDSYKK